MTRIRWYGPSLILLITVLVVMLAGPSLVRNVVAARTDARIVQTKAELKDMMQKGSSLREMSDAFEKVAEVVEPSVVHIQVLTRSEPTSDREDMLRRWFFGPQSPFGDRGQSPFGDQNGPNDQQPDDSQYNKFNAPHPYGSGSGWVYDTDGHIITNNHVVRLPDGSVAKDIKVKFFDGSERDGTVVATDPKTDIAVLKVDGGNLHPAAIDDSGVRQGEIVFAFGSPFRFDFSMSQGIVSARNRQLGIIHNAQGQAGYENFIQTDAAINPGNSGGPLTNIYGQVVGMNSAIASRNGAFNGIGFAIPVNMITDVANQIIKTGKVSRGYLGIYIDNLDPKMAQTFGYDGEGVLVVNPITGSPAEKAGVKSGDIITRLNDKPVTSADELRFQVADLKPGTKITLTVFRDGKTQPIDVTLDELPVGPQQVAGAVEGDNNGSASQPKGMQTLLKYGIDSVDTFTKDKAGQLGADFQPGALVLSVRRGSVADAVGITRGALITKVMGDEVKTARDLMDAMDKVDTAKPVRLQVQVWNPNDNQFMPRFVVLDLPK